MTTVDHYSRGLELQELGRTDEAIAEYGRAIELAPDDPDPLINRGRLLDDKGDPAGALADYDRAVALKSDEEIAWSNRGNSLASLERFEDAIISYRRALALDPEHEPARYGLSTALMSLGHLDEANRARPVGTRLDPGEVVEATHPLARGVLVLRYYPGRHSAPEQLTALAGKILEHCATFEKTPLGLRGGVRIQFGWSMLTLRVQGDRHVLCEPDFTGHFMTQLRYHASFTLQTALMLGLMHQLVDAPPSPCTLSDLVTVEVGALERVGVTMRRIADAKDGVSGWVIGSGTGPRVDMPTGALAAVRPHAIKVLSLPPGYVVTLEGHAVTSVRDGMGREALEPAMEPGLA